MRWNLCFVVVVIVSTSACRVDPIPAVDTDYPEVTVNWRSRVITSSHPPPVSEAVVCPGGSSAIGGDVMAVPAFPIPVLVAAGDAGGVQTVRATLKGGRVSGVVPADADVRTVIVAGEELKVVSQTFSRAEAQTGRTLSFEITPDAGTPLGGADTVQIDGGAKDYAGNWSYTGFPVVGTLQALCR